MATINITLRKTANKQGEYPLVLRITKNRKSKLITLKLTCKLKDWDDKKNEFKRSYPNVSQRNRVLLQLKDKALKIIDEFHLDDIDFTLNQFEDKFRGKASNKITVSEFWLEKIDDLNKAGRTGNARAYKDTYTSFFKYYTDKKLLFRELNPTLLEKYETALRSNKNTDGGIALKMREIRALFNNAIKRGVVDEKYYPFKAYKISKFKKGSNKKALTRNEFKKLESIDKYTNPNLIDSINYMVFSYYTGGMNFIDMLKLEWKNISGNRINYIRSKTKGSFSIEILEPAKKILEYYKNLNRNSKYVFPILLNENSTPQQIENRKLTALDKFNKDLQKIAQIQGVQKHVTSYTIRHSFATNLKFAGVSTDVISDAMGHKSLEITNSYLKKHTNETIDSEMKKLLQEPEMK